MEPGWNFGGIEKQTVQREGAREKLDALLKPASRSCLAVSSPHTVSLRSEPLLPSAPNFSVKDLSAKEEKTNPIDDQHDFGGLLTSVPAAGHHGGMRVPIPAWVRGGRTILGGSLAPTEFIPFFKMKSNPSRH